jgi:hypothetical protein
MCVLSREDCCAERWHRLAREALKNAAWDILATRSSTSSAPTYNLLLVHNADYNTSCDRSSPELRPPSARLPARPLQLRHAPRRAMGRRKISIAPISDDRNRSVTFLKRKNGLFKKAFELGILCSADVAVIVFSNQGKLFE